jgi:plasmid stabilization system protein ParE
MKYSVEIAPAALVDADLAYRRLTQFSERRAKRWFYGLIDAIYSLEEFPERCPVSPESELLDIEVRHLVYGKRSSTYKIFFSVDYQEAVVRVYRIWHGMRDWITPEALSGTA